MYENSHSNYILGIIEKELLKEEKIDRSDWKLIFPDLGIYLKKLIKNGYGFNDIKNMLKIKALILKIYHNIPYHYS